MFELCCEYLSVRCIWLYVIVMSRASFKVNLHSIVCQTDKMAKWLSVRLQTKWLWVRIPLQSLKLQIWRLLRARSSLTFRQTIECRFTLKLVHDMTITYRKVWSWLWVNVHPTLRGQITLLAIAYRQVWSWLWINVHPTLRGQITLLKNELRASTISIFPRFFVQQQSTKKSDAYFCVRDVIRGI